MDFFSQVLIQAVAALKNDYRDNWDFERFKPEAQYKKRSLVRWMKRCLATNGIIWHKDLIDLTSSLVRESRAFEFLYQRLADSESRDLLIQVLLYRVLGHRRIRLPLSNSEYWSALKTIRGLADPLKKLDSGFGDLKLDHFSLQKIGFDIQLYFSAQGVLTDFVVLQYVYNKGSVNVGPKLGDVVIDGGGCWGDTALYFANAVGQDGRVFTFEFAPFNLSILRANLSLNPILASRVEVIDRPLGQLAGQPVYWKENGPASQVSFHPAPGFSGSSLIATIDELVKTRKVERVDMIKLDIEGAELHALKGAIETLRVYRPNLAVALYHSREDFDAIPRFVDSLNLGYKYYLSHCTIHKEETILFATAR